MARAAATAGARAAGTAGSGGFGHLAAFLACFRQADCNGLLAAGHRFAGPAALQGAALLFMQRRAHLFLRLFAVLRHLHLLKRLGKARVQEWSSGADRPTIGTRLVPVSETSGGKRVNHLEIVWRPSIVICCRRD